MDSEYNGLTFSCLYRLTAVYQSANQEILCILFLNALGIEFSFKKRKIVTLYIISRLLGRRIVVVLIFYCCSQVLRLLRFINNTEKHSSLFLFYVTF
jgi:hypothetical protein